MADILSRQGVFSPRGSLYFSRCVNKMADILHKQNYSNFACCKNTVKIFRLCVDVAVMCFVSSHKTEQPGISLTGLSLL